MWTLAPRSASPSMIPPTQSEASLEMTAAHCCSTGSTAATPDAASSQPAPQLKATARGMDRGAAEEIPEGRLVGQPPENVVAEDVQAVGHSHDRIEQHRIGGDGDPEPRVEEHGFAQPVQQRHGKASVHERIRYAAPVDILVPAQQRQAAEPAAAHDRLDDVATGSDAQPDEGAEVSQQPPVLGQGKGQEGRDEPHQHLEPVAQGGVEIERGEPLGPRLCRVPGQGQVVGRVHLPAEHDQIAAPARSDPGVLRKIVHLAGAHQSPHQRHAAQDRDGGPTQGRDRLPWGVGVPLAHGGGHGQTQGPEAARAMQQGPDGPDRQRFKNGEPHAEAAR